MSLVRAALTEEWMKHGRFVLWLHLSVVALVAALYWVETSMLVQQLSVVSGLPGLTPEDAVEALAADLAVLTPGHAADHALGLVMASLIGTVLAALVGARLAGAEHGWRTASGLLVRRSRWGVATTGALAALAVVASLAVVAVLVGWIGSAASGAVLAGALPGIPPQEWAQPSGNVAAMIAGAVLARSLDLGLAFLLAVVTRSTLAAFVVPVAASLVQLGLAGVSPGASLLPAVTQASVWPELLRYPPGGGLLYEPLGATGSPLSATLPLTFAVAALCLAAHALVTVRREYRA